MRKLFAALLRFQAKRLLRAHRNAKIVVVAGSVGKTSTTQAIAQVLHQELAVRTTIGNYNTDIGVPCSMFGVSIPASLRNPISWAVLFARTEVNIHTRSRVDVFVLELGTDTPGEIDSFAWVKPDIAVVTAVSEEHMEFFHTLEAVAKEELAVASYSTRTFVNARMIPDDLLRTTYPSHNYEQYDRDNLSSFGLTSQELSVIGDHSIDAVVAALTVAKQLGMSEVAMREGARRIVPQKGRMQKLEGISQSILIDDTYNASPAATIAALDYAYQATAPQKIVLLGNMNELGALSADAHTQVGAYCDPDKIQLVVTLGPDSNKYLAPAAKAKGCNVVECETPQEAATVIAAELQPGALVLLKGSQNGVYAEETVKLLLAHEQDQEKLVRQSPEWLAKKAKAFGGESS